MFEGLTIPAGVSTISFELTVASSLSAFELDALTTLPFDQAIIYDIDIQGATVCLDNLSDYGELILPYCTYCTQVPITPFGLVPSSSTIAINLLTVNSSEFDNWLANTPNGYIALSSSKRGFVITRATPCTLMLVIAKFFPLYTMSLAVTVTVVEFNVTEFITHSISAGSTSIKFTVLASQFVLIIWNV